MQIALIILVVLQLADIYTTLEILKQHGTESNPILAAMFDHLGVIPSLIIVKTAMVLVVSTWVTDWRYVAGFCVFYAGIVLWNLKEMRK